MLDDGVNDLGGTSREETISRTAGSANGSRKSVAELHAMAGLAGRRATSHARAEPAGRG